MPACDAPELQPGSCRERAELPLLDESLEQWFQDRGMKRTSHDDGFERCREHGLGGGEGLVCERVRFAVIDPALGIDGPMGTRRELVLGSVRGSRFVQALSVPYSMGPFDEGVRSFEALAEVATDGLAVDIVVTAEQCASALGAIGANAAATRAEVLESFKQNDDDVLPHDRTRRLRGITLEREWQLRSVKAICATAGHYELTRDGVFVRRKPRPAAR